MLFNLNTDTYSVLRIETTMGNERTAINVNMVGVTEFLYKGDRFLKYGEMPGDVRISEYCNEAKTLTIFVNHSLNQAMLCNYCPPPPNRKPRPWKN